MDFQWQEASRGPRKPGSIANFRFKDGRGVDEQIAGRALSSSHINTSWTAQCLGPGCVSIVVTHFGRQARLPGVRCLAAATAHSRSANSSSTRFE